MKILKVFSLVVVTLQMSFYEAGAASQDPSRPKPPIAPKPKAKPPIAAKPNLYQNLASDASQGVDSSLPLMAHEKPKPRRRQLFAFKTDTLQQDLAVLSSSDRADASQDAKRVVPSKPKTQPSFLAEGQQKEYFAAPQPSHLSYVPKLLERKTALTLAEVTTQLVRFLKTQDLEQARKINEQSYYTRGGLKQKILERFNMDDSLADSICFYVLHPGKNETLEDMVKAGLEDNSYDATRVTLKKSS